MADNDSDLISQVKVEGTEAAAAELEAYAKRGKQAFEDVADAAKRSSDGTRKSSEDLAKGIDQAADALKNIERASARSNFSAGTIRNLNNMEKGFRDFRNSLQRTTLAIGRFAQRATLMATGLAAVGVAVARTATQVAKTADGTAEATDTTTKALSKGIDAQLESRTAAINLASAQRQLAGQYQRGEISLSDYQKGLVALNRDAAEQARVTQQLKNAQEDAAEAQEKLNKAAADRKAYQGLVDTFGGPLTASLVQFGRSVENIRKQFVGAFGPGLSTIIDKITQTLSVNAGAISNFFATAGKQFSDFATKNAPAIEKALENVGSAAGSVFTGLIAAGPSLLALFNDGLVPAVKYLAGMFNSLAESINSTFGTKLTGGAIAASLAILQFSGALRLIFALFRTIIPLGLAFGNMFFAIVRNATPVGVAITLLLVGLTALYKTSPQFKAWAESGKAAFGTITTAITKFLTWVVMIPVNIVKGFGIMWGMLTSGASTAVTEITTVWGTITTFFSGLWTTITTGASGLWTSISGAATAAYDTIIGYWTPISEFFSALWARLSADGATVWNGYVALATLAYNGIVALWGTITTFFSNLWTSITTSAKGLWDGITKGAGDAWKFITDLWGAAVDFFSGVLNGVIDVAQGVWDRFVAGWQDVYNRVSKIFTDLLSWAEQKLKPIIDFLKTIIALTGATGGTGSDGAVQRAGGGRVRGPGTGTSDSIPAWLSNNEFVIRARAVRKYGADFLNAVNSGRFDLGRIAKFATGGLVDTFASMGAATPRYAFAPSQASAPGRPGATVNLSFGGRTFQLMAPADIADGLAAHATSKSVASSGRKPRWQRG